MYPIHNLLQELETHVVNHLPAAYSLTGCDTVAKVGTKGAMLKALQDSSELLQNFGHDRLDENMILAAEQFLVKVVATKDISNCSTFIASL